MLSIIMMYLKQPWRQAPRTSRKYLVRNISRYVSDFLKNILLGFVFRSREKGFPNYAIPFSNDAPGGWKMLINRGSEIWDARGG